MKIELHSDEAAAQEQSLGNKVSYSSQDILPIHPPLQRTSRDSFFHSSLIWRLVPAGWRFMLHHSLRRLVEQFP